MNIKAYIRQIAYYLPEKTESNPENRLTQKIGILTRHISADGETASDLAVKAAEKLFAQGIDSSKVEYFLLCTQSPDYIFPTTACILQEKLGLSETCGAMDLSLGCSGFVYGLGLAKGLIETGQVKNVLLITSTVYTKYINPEDNTLRPLIGDGATATFIEGIPAEEDGICGLTYGTRSKGNEKIILPVGGMRNPYSSTPVVEYEDSAGNKRTNYDFYMDGRAVTDFALDVVPQLVENVLAKLNLKKEDIDYYVFHQANRIILKYLQEACGLLESNYWNEMAEYGNTGSNSIPIGLADMLKENDSSNLQRVMLCGFGAGLSWGGCVVDLRKIMAYKS